MFKSRVLDVYSAKPSADQAAIDGYKFAKLEAHHFNSAEFCQPRLQLFYKRFEQDFFAFGYLTSEDQLVYYMWLSLWRYKGWAPWALGSNIVLPKASGYIFDCKTSPQHRRKGIYTSALNNARWICHRAFCKKVLIDVGPSNEPAVKAIKRAGFLKADTIGIKKFGPIYLTTRSSGSSLRWKEVVYQF